NSTKYHQYNTLQVYAHDTQSQRCEQFYQVSPASVAQSDVGLAVDQKDTGSIPAGVGNILS
ncbi:MAG: hypothetical protein N0E48_12920, partial [Candidatus Thiodiazotropha endolucinida]|nr:hypothetical protein [Candidatus Thiodiazotropha taylori]MCW4344232.1 hypothetical protein [Candidatus Thiodiazotropha endolucinida]